MSESKTLQELMTKIEELDNFIEFIQDQLISVSGSLDEIKSLPEPATDAKFIDDVDNTLTKVSELLDGITEDSE
ncbi:MAG: hypothetical protein JRN26_01025 [Nitrososphaerota archaeon]|jgi:archaellum component FlaC|nr:hypothetical protein [Nitrososphaerota archaeon]MDG6935462.1 hypothetical protein [Nitrososphaerota archaeon]MDG6944352.1 hypothetical protein [Nitrososphaerota archaeon]